MSLQQLLVVRDGQAFLFEPISGLLLSKTVNGSSPAKRPLSCKASTGLELNDRPYLLRTKEPCATPPQVVPKWLVLYARLLVRTCRLSFGLARVLAWPRLPVYGNGTEAILAFRQIFPTGAQQELCLPRSLFAAVTSRKFRSSGVMFIGVFLPSRSMHAWVIEDGLQPDPFDGAWLNFQPVAVYTR